MAPIVHCPVRRQFKERYGTRTPDPDTEPVPFDDKKPRHGGVNPGNTNNADARLETDIDDEDEDEATETEKGVE